MPLKLSGSQIEAFVAALSDAFDLSTLRRMLTFRLDKDLEDFQGEDRADTLFKLVVTANKQGWVDRLLEAARAFVPDNGSLIAFQESLGLTSVAAESKGSLEKIVFERSQFIDIMDFRETLGRLETIVCAIESPAGGGTGLLISPDHVLTNYHVIEPLLTGAADRKSVFCRFDFKKLPDGSSINRGRGVALAEMWNRAHSPYAAFDLKAGAAPPTASELDYAVLQLAEPVGTQSIGDKSDVGGPPRGWLALATQSAVAAAGDPIFVLQHPQDLRALPTIALRPMQLTIGSVTEIVGEGRRMRHDAPTLPGSSGSPCLNANLKVVALHHAGEPNSRLDYKGKYNQAIPIGAVIADMRQKGLVELLAAPPPVPP